MSDPRIRPAQLQVGDWITSDPRRDFLVAEIAVDEFGDVTINPGAADNAHIWADQTVTIMPRHIAALRPRPTA
jgi:hypothetical protein